MTDLIHTFARIGLYSFGGPGAQIALMHKVLVDEKKWLSETSFLNALSFCMLLPGPEAMQLATYAGWRKAGVKGGLIAGGLFVIPGAAFMALLATIYALYGNVPFIDALFFGVQATVVAIVLEALVKVTRKAIKTPGDWAVAGASFAAIFALHLPFPMIIASAALWGFLSRASTPAPAAVPATIPLQSSLSTAAIWLALWGTPIALVAALNHTFLTEIALFFSQLAIVTFGGAYAVLAYMAQTVVSDFGWITTPEMMDGLGLAETTPGPLILVTEFVAFIAGFREGGLPLAFLAAMLALWVTFIPCFLWIFLGAPYIERLIHMPRLSGALHAITAAVVGVILNLSLWFSLHVLFGEIDETTWGPFRFLWPDLTSINPLGGAIALVAALMIFWLKAGIGRTLLVGAALGLFSLASLT